MNSLAPAVSHVLAAGYICMAVEAVSQIEAESLDSTSFLGYA